MADIEDVVQDTSVSGAGAAIEALLKANPNATNDPDEQEIQPQAPAPQAQASEANDSEEVQAPAVEVPATPEVPPATVQPAAPTADPRLQEAEKTTKEATAARDHFLNALNTLIPQLENAIHGEFSDIKTQEDLLRVGQTDPDRYNRFVLAQQQIVYAKTAQQEAQAKVQGEQRAQFEAWQKGEFEKLGTLLPELKDKEKGPALARRIQEYAIASGYTPQQLALASASDFVMLRNSMEFASLKEAQAIAAKKAAKAPPVQQPGAARNVDKNEKVQEDFSRLQKTGHIRDAASVMRNFL